ncbi:hypothetical protein SUDANB132_03559 [Streptomyces sp. enrichment culture]
MRALTYHSHDTTTTVGAFTLSLLIVLAVAWYLHRRR